MTRINTNVSSLIARQTLSRSNNQLQTSLTRLSTGLRINVGKDDPAGLIASENLRRDITSVEKAVSNSERANQLIATADSALGQASSLLNDIRGLVTEAANSGVLSDEQIAANQLQVDSSLEAIDRIARTTTFQGRRLLDGSLDFITEATGVGNNFDQVAELNIDQANFGTSSQVSVEVNVSTAAAQAQVDIEDITVTDAGTIATGDLSLSNVAKQAATASPISFDDGAAGTVTVSVAAVAGENYDGTAGNLSITFDIDGTITGNAEAAVVGSTIEVKIKTAGVTTFAEIEAAIEAIDDDANTNDDFAVTLGGTGAGTFQVGDDATSDSLTGGRDVGSATITVDTVDPATTYNTKEIQLIEDGTITADTAEASLDGSNNVVVRVNGTVTYAAIAQAINDDLTDFTASVSASAGDANYITADDAPPGAPTLSGGTDPVAGGLSQDVVFELSGADGSEVFNFQAGTTLSQLKSAVDLVKDATGVEASVNGTTLELLSTSYGTDAFVDLKVIEEGTGGEVSASVGEGTRETGDDIVATVNGISATGAGNTLSINTATLDLSLTVEEAFADTINFDITGGGALFQLGPDVVSNQQARIGITSLNSSRLGGVEGRLYQLGSGEAAALENDTTLAAQIVDDVIDKVTKLRGRLGAFQRTTLDTNIAALGDTLANLSDAESSIRDADFAEESARLTRAQILVQSGTAVLSIANQNPQNVLALLR